MYARSLQMHAQFLGIDLRWFGAGRCELYVVVGVGEHGCCCDVACG